MVSPLHEPHFSPTVNKIGNTVWNFTIFHHTNQTETWLYLIIIFPNNSKNSQTWVLLVGADECGCSKTREKQFLCTHKTHDCNMKQRLFRLSNRQIQQLIYNQLKLKMRPVDRFVEKDTNKNLFSSFCITVAWKPKKQTSFLLSNKAGGMNKKNTFALFFFDCTAVSNCTFQSIIVNIMSLQLQSSLRPKKHFHCFFQLFWSAVDFLVQNFSSEEMNTENIHSWETKEPEKYTTDSFTCWGSPPP